MADTLVIIGGGVGRGSAPSVEYKQCDISYCFRKKAIGKVFLLSGTILYHNFIIMLMLSISLYHDAQIFF